MEPRPPILRESLPRLLAYLFAAFALLHVVYHLLGVRMDMTPLGVFMQYADPELLRTRLIETCWYLHIQPPLFNLFLGCVLKAFPGSETVAFEVIFLALGFGAYAGLVLLQMRLGVSRVVAVGLATVFMASPSFILYEHLLAYTLPCAFLLIVSALLLDTFLRGRHRWAGWSFFICVAVLCGTRATYHLAFYVAVAAGVLWVMKPAWRTVLWMAVVPGLFVAGIYVKNLALFGEFSACSFAGKNAWIKTIGNLRWEDKEALVREGFLSPVSLVNRYEAVPSYPAEFQQAEGYEGIPVLREMTKSSGEINYNHLAQIAIARAYRRDAVYGLFHYPKVFVATNAQAWLNYMTPPSEKAADSSNYPLLKPLAEVYDRFVFGEVNIPLEESTPLLEHHLWGTSQYLGLLVALPLLLGYGFWCACGRGRAKHLMTREQRLAVLYLCFVILYVALAGNTMELNETSRFRFETDPFYVVLAGLLIQHGAARLARTPLWLLPARVELRRAATHGAEPV
ncbi:MAG: hypothetical protein IT365_13860 [Candidatus Hydrogenedentes bacterium]|nr:hypothetical protein [Candidatus Hydrogenedentota bacterium]